MSDLVRKHFVLVLLVITLVLSLNGCVPFLIGTAVTTGTMVAIQDRSLGNTIDDTAIVIKINKDLLKANLFSVIKIKVNEGRVLLLGNVKTHQEQITAEKIAWQQKGVKEVINEIIVDGDSEAGKIVKVTQDTLISGNIKARMIATSNIRSVNYTVNTIDGAVYLMGIAQDKEELNQVISLARKVRGVKQVISYVRFKDSKLRS